MPEWFNPTLNDSLAVGLIGFFCWGIYRITGYMAPLVKTHVERRTEAAVEKAKAEATVHERNAELAVSLKTSTEQGSALLSRMVDMHNDTNVKVGGLVTDVGQLKEDVKEIRGKVGCRAHELLRPSQAAMEKPL